MAGCITDGILKAAITVAAQQGETVRSKVCHRETRDESVVKRHNRVWLFPDLVRRPCSEAGAAQAEQDGHRVAAGLRNREVRPAILIEIVEEHRRRAAPDRKRVLYGCLEAAGAVSQEHGIGVAIVVGHHQVGIAIVVDIPDRHPDRSNAGCRGDRRLEGAVSIAH